MSLVCIDSVIAIWAVKQTASPGQEDRVPLSQKLLRDLDKGKKKILLPAPIITELLALVGDNKERQDCLTYCNLHFRSAVLDANAASIELLSLVSQYIED